MARFVRNMLLFCDSYLKDEPDVQELWDSLTTSCGCSDIDHLCRDLNVVPTPNPIISWIYRLTCRETATVACKNAIESVIATKMWREVPTKNDKVCFNLYKEMKLWYTSCT